MMKEDWHKGIRNSGIYAAIYAASIFLIGPFLLLIIFLNLFARNQTSSWSDLKATLNLWLILIIIFGGILTATSYLRAYYFRGSKLRFAFAILTVTVEMLYVLTLLVFTGFQTAFHEIGPYIQMDLIAVLIFINLILNFIRWVGEYQFYRPEYLNSVGRGNEIPSRQTEDISQHKWHHDFQPHYGRMDKGVIGSRRYLTAFVVIPIVLLIFLKAIVDGIQDAAREVMENVPWDATAQFDHMMMRVLIIGLPIVFFAFLRDYFPKGNLGRMIGGVGVTFVLCIYIWLITGGGIIDIKVTDAAFFYLGFQGIVFLFIFVTSLYAVYAILEMKLYRKNWKENHFNWIE